MKYRYENTIPSVKKSKAILGLVFIKYELDRDLIVFIYQILFSTYSQRVFLLLAQKTDLCITYSMYNRYEIN